MLRKHALRPQTVCEVGCGSGAVLVEVARHVDAERLEGYDISSDAARFWAADESGRLGFHEGDFLASDGTFDLLLCLDVFEHVDDYLGFLRRIRSRAEHKIFHIPLDMSAQAVMRGTPILANRERWGHLHYFTTETALATLVDTGYEIVDWFHTASGIERGTTVVEKVARLPRKLVGALSTTIAARLLGGYSLLVLAK